MKLRVVAVGRLKQRYAREGVSEYVARVNRYLPCEVVEVRDGTAEGDEARAMALEARRIRDADAGAAYRVALDLRGKTYSSVEFARFLGDRMTYGRRDVSFVIGGPLGLDPALRREADLQLSLSALTLPHELARVLLVEQIYRALTILRGEPYHK